MKTVEEKFMKKALGLAEKGLGRTRPNPAVGAVIVKEGEIIGRGYHKKCGSAHAEIAAINSVRHSLKYKDYSLQAADNLLTGAEIFVTLEPCGHYGRTPPCAKAIVEAGIKRVFYGSPDPNPETAGKGLAILEKAGVEIIHGPLREETEHFNGPYLKWITKKIPLVTAKWAMTMDGKIATRTGHSKWITSKETRKIAHKLRDKVDAIAAGTETFLKDDPELTCRLPRGHTPLRVILDRNSRLPFTRRIFSTLEAGPVLLYTAKPQSPVNRFLRKLGIEIKQIKEKDNGLDLRSIIEDLGQRGIQHLLIEGGGTLLGRCFDLSLIDRVVLFIAPKIAGGKTAITPVAGKGVQEMENAFQIHITHTTKKGADFVFWGDIKK